MIGTCIAVSFGVAVGVVLGVGLREHNVLTMDDLKASAARMIATAKSLANKPAKV